MKPKEQIIDLPCGLKVDIAKGQCCMTMCPKKYRTCEEIENCEYWREKKDD